MMLARTPKRALVIHTLPAFVAFLSLLLGAFSMTVVFSTFIGLSLETRLTHSNPLAAYEAIWPGQSITSLVNDDDQTIANALRCYSPQSSGGGYPVGVTLVSYAKLTLLHAKTSCLAYIKDDLFHLITVDIQDEQIHELDLASNTLQPDTLLLYWGAPDAIQRGADGRNIYLRWNRSTYTATATIPATGSVVSFLSLVSAP